MGWEALCVLSVIKERRGAEGRGGRQATQDDKASLFLPFTLIQHNQLLLNPIAFSKAQIRQIPIHRFGNML